MELFTRSRLWSVPQKCGNGASFSALEAPSLLLTDYFDEVKHSGGPEEPTFAGMKK
jgi:hypothetical protein